MNEFAYADNEQPPNVLSFNKGANSGCYLFIVDSKYSDGKHSFPHVFFQFKYITSFNSCLLQQRKMKCVTFSSGYWLNVSIHWATPMLLRYDNVFYTWNITLSCLSLSL